MSVRLELDLRGVEEMLARLRAAPEVLERSNRGAMRQAVLLVESAVKARTPRRTGRLFASIGSEVSGQGGDLQGRISTNVKYSPFVEFSTRPHEIRPVRAQALMIPLSAAGGQGGARLTGRPRAGQAVAFYRHVHHPGTRGRHMFREGLEASKAGVRKLFKAAADAALEVIGG